MKRLVLLLLIFTIFLSFSRSRGENEKRTENPCNNPVTTLEVLNCETYKLDKAENQLKQIYERTKYALEKQKRISEKKKLAISQASWSKYREDNCDLMSYSFHEGTIYPVVKTVCRRRMAQERIVEIQRFLNDYYTFCDNCPVHKR